MISGPGGAGAQWPGSVTVGQRTARPRASGQPGTRHQVVAGRERARKGLPGGRQPVFVKIGFWREPPFAARTWATGTCCTPVLDFCSAHACPLLQEEPGALLGGGMAGEGQRILRLRGLPFSATAEDLENFFQEWEVQATHICHRNGEGALPGPPQALPAAPGSRIRFNRIFGGQNKAGSGPDRLHPAPRRQAHRGGLRRGALPLSGARMVAQGR